MAGRPRRNAANAAAAEGAPKSGTLSSYFRNLAKGAVVPEARAAAAVGAAVVEAAALDEEDLELREEDEDEEEEVEPVFEEEEVNGG